jgi:hypothetical protein
MEVNMQKGKIKNKLAGVSLLVIITLAVSIAEAQQIFNHPQVDGVAVDWCLNWAADCGKPAADRFCQDHGFPQATRFEVAEDVGPTRILATGQECNDPRCDGFAVIECAGTSSANQPTPVPRIPGRVPKLPNLLPSGANIWYMKGDIPMSADFAAKGQSTRFYWNVEKVPNAQGVLWQVNQAPFEASPTSLTLAASGKGSGVQGSFIVDFANIPRPPLGMGRTVGNQPLWYVRVVPIGASDATVGLASNVIRVFDQEAPSSSIDKIDTGQWYEQPGLQIRLTRFESVPYKYVAQWPSGCEPYQGAGHNKYGWGWVSGTVTNAFDWTSQAYEDAKNYVVTGVITVFPFVPREAAEIALDAALASCGIPPSIPNLDQLMNSGADYLASQMVDELANQVPAGSALEQFGKDELRRRIQQQTKEVLVQNAKKIREALAQKSKYCMEMEYPPYLNLTIQNVGSQPVENFEIRAGIADLEVQKEFYQGLLNPFDPIKIDRLDPGESQTIPIDIFSHMNVNAVLEDKTTSYSEKDIGHWMQLYRKALFSFSVTGGRTIKYKAMSEGGSHLQEEVVNDGTGISFKSQKRTWMDDPFVSQ